MGIITIEKINPATKPSILDDISSLFEWARKPLSDFHTQEDLDQMSADTSRETLLSIANSNGSFASAGEGHEESVYVYYSLTSEHRISGFIRTIITKGNRQERFSDSGLIDLIARDPRYKSQGVGRALVRAFEHDAFNALGLPLTAAYVHRNNHPSRNLFEKSGYIPYIHHRQPHSEYFYFTKLRA